jgi:selenocysteine-specific elongation factor
MHHVVATAGHVDHGKSTLVRALTGMEPDRWAEERRRGLTIDLGFAWTALPSGREVAFVDVPGHERFLGNMLAGLGPAPVVLFVVAADSGWQAQSTDHANAVAALGISRGLIVVTRSDLAPGRAEPVADDARMHLAGTGLADARAIVVSGQTGAGLDDLRSALDDLLADAPAVDVDAPVRLWVDRSFTIGGAGTVVTGTLAAGRLSVGDDLVLHAGGRTRTVRVRGLHRQDRPAATVGPVSRVAVNLRGLGTDDVGRGDVLTTPDAWHRTAVVDVRRTAGDALTGWPTTATAHLGTAAHEARIRPFDDDHARLTLPTALPLVHGDRLVVRAAGGRGILGGLQVLDADPPPLVRRGDGARRAAVLAAMSPAGDVAHEVARRRAVHADALRMLHLLPDEPPTGTTVAGGWWVHDEALHAWAGELTRLVDDAHAADELARGIPRAQARDTLDLPDDRVLDAVVEAAGLDHSGGHVHRRGRLDDLGPVEAAVAALEARLSASAFDAPDADDLSALHLGARELAAAERVGRLLRLGSGVVLLPTAPGDAVRILGTLPQPFTVSAAREALGTTRRVAIPLLELLDARHLTRRLPDGRRALR